jgi:hypothetical protein
VDTGGTGNAKAHLVKHHSRQIQTQNEKRIKGYQQTIDMAQFCAQSDAANHKRRRLDIRDEGDNERGQGSELDPAVLDPEIHTVKLIEYLHSIPLLLFHN